MVNFSVARAIGLVLRTWPFLVLRLVIWALVCAGYGAGVGGGAVMGLALGALWSSPAGGAALGALAGFAAASALLFWLRAYITYLLKGGHVAALVAAHDGLPLPLGFGQVGYALAIVRERFVEVNVLFAVDLLIKGVVGTLCGLISGAAAPLGLGGLTGLLTTVLRLSTFYVDELILARNIRTREADPFSGAQDALVLYAQNAWAIARNALVLALVCAGLGLGAFILLVGPFGLVAAFAPEALTEAVLTLAGLALAALAALALVYAAAEPFCIACLMQVYFGVTEGQRPDPSWRRTLETASSAFRKLGEEALAGL